MIKIKSKKEKISKKDKDLVTKIVDVVKKIKIEIKPDRFGPIYYERR